MIEVEPAFGGRLAEAQGLFERGEIGALVAPGGIADVAAGEAGAGDGDDFAGEIADGAEAQIVAGNGRGKAEARHVIFHSYDGYTTNVAFDVFAADDVIIAHEWEGQNLPREHGGPVRIVIPRFYFWKSAKWVKRIEFSRDDKPGFWEVRGYHNVGDPWREERYS